MCINEFSFHVYSAPVLCWPSSIEDCSAFYSLVCCLYCCNHICNAGPLVYMGIHNVFVNILATSDSHTCLFFGELALLQSEWETESGVGSLCQVIKSSVWEFCKLFTNGISARLTLSLKSGGLLPSPLLPSILLHSSVDFLPWSHRSRQTDYSGGERRCFRMR